MRSKTGQGLSASVQGFCDVSVREYATVVYLRKETLEGVPEVCDIKDNGRTFAFL